MRPRFEKIKLSLASRTEKKLGNTTSYGPVCENKVKETLYLAVCVKLLTNTNTTCSTMYYLQYLLGCTSYLEPPDLTCTVGMESAHGGPGYTSKSQGGPYIASPMVRASKVGMLVYDEDATIKSWECMRRSRYCCRNRPSPRYRRCCSPRWKSIIKLFLEEGIEAATRYRAGASRRSADKEAFLRCGSSGC